MSHISSQTVSSLNGVHPMVLAEGIKVACQLLALSGIQVTDFVYDWSGNKTQSHNKVQIICALGAEGAVKDSKFGGLGLGVSDGKLTIVGDFYYDWQKAQAKKIQAQLETVLGGACYFAARALIATAKGQKTNVTVNQETQQLQLVVEN